MRAERNLVFEGNELVASVHASRSDNGEAERLAARIVLCVNACRDWSDWALEGGRIFERFMRELAQAVETHLRINQSLVRQVQDLEAKVREYETRLKTEAKP